MERRRRPRRRSATLHARWTASKTLRPSYGSRRPQSFAEAARQLRVSKSVVTSRVKQLEDHVGAPLFHRSTRVVRLSDAGQAFLRDCVELVGRANDIMDQMRDAKGGPRSIAWLIGRGLIVIALSRRID